VAARIGSVLRSTDLLARIAEDGMVVVCASDIAGATAVLDRVLARLGEPVTIEGRTFPIAAAAGLVPALPGMTSELLLDAARSALAKAKRPGGSPLVVG
jgi:GGDEF domain-containing protein